ncbi:Zinc/iron permease [Apodospora peruviana]|uniref:Zinc/iron permease n=1 Tax=Apodospora peruviana TaxID=516989 RepID=A0AAE0IQ38_9PEZI|nr:Zinc/iron permease [Apodospora peruviana]
METLNITGNEPSWSLIPTELLLAELSRRGEDAANTDNTRPKCGSEEQGTYDTGLHVGALILILVISTVSCGFPLFSRRSTKGGKRQRTVLFICQHFGTGVLMATAFVHLLPTAFTSLTDPCLPHAFSKGYRPLAGLIAMVSALVVVALESYLTTRGASHSHSHHIWEELDDDDDEDEDGSEHHHSGFSGHRRRGYSTGRSSRPANIELEDREAAEGLVAGVSPLPASSPITTVPQNGKVRRQMGGPGGGRSSDDGEDDSSDRESLELELTLDELGLDDSNDALRRPRGAASGTTKSEPSGPGLLLPVANIPPNDAEEQRRLLLQCVLLEAGILFHSVFIGMALSVATGPTFAVFLIAIAFHQSFEGLALGTRIAAIHFPRSSPRPWLMVLAFGATTPVGQAIGLFVHRFYDPMSQTGLLMVGFMNAISSGLLLFAGLVQLLAEDFLSEKSYKALHGTRRVHAFLAVVAGAGLMAGVGAIA